MVVFLLDILISLMVLGISFFSVKTVKFKSSNLDNISTIYGFVGIFLVGTGMYIGGGESLKAYYYITFIIELIILVLFILIYRLIKRKGHSRVINICSIFLNTISFLFYIYYIIASFTYY